eukprot:c19741_g1_i1 orf=130-561(-)
MPTSSSPVFFACREEQKQTGARSPTPNTETLSKVSLSLSLQPFFLYRITHLLYVCNLCLLYNLVSTFFISLLISMLCVPCICSFVSLPKSLHVAASHLKFRCCKLGCVCILVPSCVCLCKRVILQYCFGNTSNRACVDCIDAV